MSLNRPPIVGEFGRHKNIKTRLNQRLGKEGRFDAYRDLVGALVHSGVDDSGEMAAWKIAAFAFAPVNGQPSEIKADPMYAEIAAGWANGKYPDPPGFAHFPNGFKNFDKLAEEPSPEFKAVAEKVKKAPAEWNERWKKLANAVEIPNAPLVEEVLWVVAHRWTDPEDIDTEEAPSKAAVCKLSLAQESSANFANFLNNFESKLIPTKQVADAESRRDDGRPLSDLEELEALLDMEESNDESETVGQQNSGSAA